MRIAIIPARGGSKRIPRKNIKMFYGKPMIAYSIKAAQESGLFDRIVVTTDDEEIADVARSYGAEIPFMRPKELSDDHTATIPVIAHAIQTLTKRVGYRLRLLYLCHSTVYPHRGYSKWPITLLSPITNSTLFLLRRFRFRFSVA